MTGNGTGNVEALREEIRRTRVELGETMELLAARADVKARLRESAEQARERMREQAVSTVARLRGPAPRRSRLARERGYEEGGGRGSVPWAVVAAGAVVAVVVVLIVRGRRG